MNTLLQVRVPRGSRVLQTSLGMSVVKDMACVVPMGLPKIPISLIVKASSVVE
jgi:hypothetical protein